jgi:hypothetical protein
MVMVRSEVIEAIKTSIVDIEFIKKDGAVRLMTCTLREESLPAQKDMVQVISEKAPNEEVLAVFDTHAQGWRSFRWDSLKRVNGVDFVQ